MSDSGKAEILCDTYGHVWGTVIGEPGTPGERCNCGEKVWVATNYDDGYQAGLAVGRVSSLDGTETSIKQQLDKFAQHLGYRDYGHMHTVVGFAFVVAPSVGTQQPPVVPQGERPTWTSNPVPIAAAALEDICAKSEPQKPGGQQVNSGIYQMSIGTRQAIRRIIRDFLQVPAVPQGERDETLADVLTEAEVGAIRQKPIRPSLYGQYITREERDKLCMSHERLRAASPPPETPTQRVREHCEKEIAMPDNGRDPVVARVTRLFAQEILNRLRETPETPAPRGTQEPGEPLAIAGRFDGTYADFMRNCHVLLAEEQAKVNPDNALFGVLCDAVRIAREVVLRAALAPTGERPRTEEKS